MSDWGDDELDEGGIEAQPVDVVVAQPPEGVPRDVVADGAFVEVK